MRKNKETFREGLTDFNFAVSLFYAIKRSPQKPMLVFLVAKSVCSTRGGMGFYGEMPESYNLVVNVNHPLIEQVLNESDADKQKQLVHQLTDLALLANGLLKGEALTEFVKRSIEMI